MRVAPGWRLPATMRNQVNIEQNMIETKTVVTVQDDVVSFTEVKDKVCEILGVKNLREDGLGWDFWWEVWVQHADDCIVSCEVSQCAVSIEGLLERFADNPKAVQVLEAFKQVLGDELSEDGVYFEYD
jgi:hypothetical protein